MATDTVPAAVPEPPGHTATTDQDPKGFLASMVAAVEPARSTFDLTPTTGQATHPADADGALDRSAPGKSSAAFRDTTEQSSKGSDAAGARHKRSVWKEMLLAAATRWAKGGGAANKRLDLAKAKAQAHQVKETRTTTVAKSGGLPVRNSGGSGAGSNKGSRKSGGNSSGKGPTNSSGNRSNGSGRGGSGGGPGGSGGGRGTGGGTGKGSSDSSGRRHKDSAGPKDGRGNHGSGGGSGSGPGKAKDSAGSGTGAKDDRRSPASKDSGKRPGSSNNGPGKQGASGNSGKDGSSGKPGSGTAGSGGKTDLTKGPKNSKSDKKNDKHPGPHGATNTPAGKDNHPKSTADGRKDSKDSKDDKAGKQHTASGKTPLEKSRETGHGDGTKARRVIDHVKAYTDGTRDGWHDEKAKNAKEHDRLDKAHTTHKTKTGPKPAQPVIVTEKEDDGVTTDVKPLTVQSIDANTLTLGADATRTTYGRRELRNFKQYERKLEAKEAVLQKISDACVHLKKEAEDEAKDCQTLLEQAKSVEGGEKLIGQLNKLADAAKNQATEAAELAKQAKRAAEMCKVVLTNIQTRYAPLYKAVVDSDETKPAELRFYNDKGSYAPAA